MTKITIFVYTKIKVVPKTFGKGKSRKSTGIFPWGLEGIKFEAFDVQKFRSLLIVND